MIVLHQQITSLKRIWDASLYIPLESAAVVAEELYGKPAIANVLRGLSEHVDLTPQSFLTYSNHLFEIFLPELEMIFAMKSLPYTEISAKAEEIIKAIEKITHETNDDDEFSPENRKRIYQIIGFLKSDPSLSSS